MRMVTTPESAVRTPPHPLTIEVRARDVGVT